MAEQHVACSDDKRDLLSRALIKLNHSGPWKFAFHYCPDDEVIRFVLGPEFGMLCTKSALSLQKLEEAWQTRRGPGQGEILTGHVPFGTPPVVFFMSSRAARRLDVFKDPFGWQSLADFANTDRAVRIRHAAFTEADGTAVVIAQQLAMSPKEGQDKPSDSFIANLRRIEQQFDEYGRDDQAVLHRAIGNGVWHTDVVIAQERSILSVVRNTEGMDGVIVYPHDGTLGIPNVAAMVTGWAGDDDVRAFQQLAEGLSSITTDELHLHGFHFSVEDNSSPASVHTWRQHFVHEPMNTNSGAGQGSVPPSASPLLRGTEAQVRAPLRVTCFLPAFNAGETTRGIELCRGLVAQARGRKREVTVRLAYSTSDPDYEAQIIASGFEAHRLALHLDEATVSGIMAADHEAAEHVSDLGTARRFIRAVMDEIIASTPDLVVCGFVPPVGIAAQILQVPAVVYLPFPAYRPWVRGHLLKDIPDDLDNALTSGAPAPVRRLFAKLLSAAMLTKGFFKQPTFAAAGRELGWRAARPDLFAMLAAPLQVVTDLPASYRGQHVGPNTRITGPLFSLPPDVEVASAIREMFSPGPHNRVFVSMGSSGEKPYLLAAVEALATMQVRAVVVVAPRICSLAEVRQSLPIPSHILLTDSFVPAHQVNAMADAAVIHGGQGTVQTAVSAGTPIVGVGMQVEQSTNLDNVAHRGAGIRIPKRHWTPERIRRALGRVLEVPSFQQSAARLKCEHDAIDGRKEVARAIWEFVDSSAL